ncbi:MAG TPA: HAD family phosphatase [Chitinophagaceae bacterium]|nr:HAD family phosphatase [Chitinophagaceae bacterium]
MSDINTIIFDLGGVLIDWNPKYVFDENYFDSVEKRNYFFSHICTNDWNEKQDEGRLIAEATNELIVQYPEWEKPIRDYYGRWTEMLGGSIQESVEIFRQLKQNPTLKFYALTNWSAELFPVALERYDFLHWFDGRVVSGEERIRKPFPEIYQRLLNKYNLNASEALFIDDSVRNVKGAEAVGIKSIHFKDSQQLQEDLNCIQLF